MAYCTQTDIELIHGQRNVITWSNLDNNVEAAVTSVIDNAIARADAFIDDELRSGPYAIPLVDKLTGITPLTIKFISAELAGYFLFLNRGLRDSDVGERMMQHKKEAESYLNMCRSGQRQLNAVRSDNTPTAPSIA